MDAQPLRQPCVLTHCRAHQRVAEAQLVHIEVNERRANGWVERRKVELPFGDDASRSENLAQAPAIAQRRDFHQHARVLRQLRDAGRECSLKALSKRY